MRGAIQGYTTKYGYDAALGAQNAQFANIKYNSNGDAIYSEDNPRLNPYREVTDMLKYGLGGITNGGCKAISSDPGKSGKDMDTPQAIWNAGVGLSGSVAKVSLLGTPHSDDVKMEYCPGIFFSSIKTNVSDKTTVPFPGANLIFRGKSVGVNNSSFNLIPIPTNAEFARNMDYVQDLLGNLTSKEQQLKDKIDAVNKDINKLEYYLCKFKIFSSGCSDLDAYKVGDDD